MRGALLLLPLLLLTACENEPDFDARYDKAAKEIEARARAMDADIAKSDQAEDLPQPAKPSNAATSSGE